MTKLSEFEACNQPRVACRRSLPGQVAAYQRRVPDTLLDHWKEVGWCGYSNGAFWMTNPAEYQSFAERVPDLKGGVVVGRTAFASLYVWKADRLLLYSPLNGRAAVAGEDVEAFFNITCCFDLFKRDILHEKVFQRAQRRLGPLEHDECYGYSLLPALGGDASESTLMKAKIIPYLEIARQALEA